MGHVVMYSGGVGSYTTAKRVIQEHGPENVVLLFADVKGSDNNPFTGEDDDCYRFINESAEKLGAELVTVFDGRNIWEVFKDRRWIGNSRMAHCSELLKQKPCRMWLEENCDPEDTVVYVGIDWTEAHRLPKIVQAYLPYVAKAPLTEPPYLEKRQMLDECRADGIEPPRMYKLGYPHANCQGACVKAGMAQWRKVLETAPATFAYHEKQEEELRGYLGTDVSILRDNQAGTPLTLRGFRERVQNGQASLFDVEDYEFEYGGCGCFTDYGDAGAAL